MIVDIKQLAYRISFCIGNTILVVKNSNDWNKHLSIISLYEDDSTSIERCQLNIEHERRSFFGEILDNKYVLCGGYDTNDIWQNDCKAIGVNGIKTFNMSYPTPRSWSIAVKLNQSAMLITGGYYNNDDLFSTEIITTEGSHPGIDLPFTVYGHCMVQIKPNTIILIGGTQNGEWFSNKTWIIDTLNGFHITEGPTLKTGLSYPKCYKPDLT